MTIRILLVLILSALVFGPTITVLIAAVVVIPICVVELLIRFARRYRR